MRRMPVRQELLHAEAVLRTAMLASDIDTLDSLLSPELIFIGPHGEISTKADDIAMHRSGRLRLTVLFTQPLVLAVTGRVAVTVVDANLAGSVDGVGFEGLFRYTRTWICDEHHHWQVLTAVCVPVANAG